MSGTQTTAWLHEVSAFQLEGQPGPECVSYSHVVSDEAGEDQTGLLGVFQELSPQTGVTLPELRLKW